MPEMICYGLGALLGNVLIALAVGSVIVRIVRWWGDRAGAVQKREATVAAAVSFLVALPLGWILPVWATLGVALARV